MGKVRYKEISEEYNKIGVASTSRKSLGFESKVKEYYFIKIDDLEPFQHQARKIFKQEDLESLSASIAEVGITSPLLVVPSVENGKYQVINGERRLRAAKIAGLTDLPCIITHDSNKSKLIALVDNIQRADLHPIELADAYNNILEKNEEKDQISLSVKLGVSASKISETIALYALPDEVKSYLLNNDIRSREFLRKIKKCRDKNEMLNLLSPNKKIKKGNSKKNILSIFISEGNFHVDFQIIKMDDGQKNDFKKKLLDIISKL